MSNFESIIPWRLLQGLLKQRLIESDYRLRRATSNEDMLRQQGRSQELEELVEHLPQLLTIAEEEKEAMLQTKKAV